MSNRQKNSRLLLGMALGMSAGYFIKSKRGQDMIKDSRSYMVNQYEKTKKNSSQALESANEYLNDLATKGRAYLNKAEATIDRETPDAKDIESKIYRELDDLHRKIDAKKAELDALVSDYTDLNK